MATKDKTNVEDFLEKRELILDIQDSPTLTAEEKKAIRKRKKVLHNVRAFLDRLSGTTRNKAVREDDYDNRLV